MFDFRKRRQLIERAQSKIIEETSGRSQQLGVSRYISMPHHPNPLALHQGFDDVRVDRDATNRLDLGTRDRLSVGDERQRLEQRPRILLRPLRPKTTHLARVSLTNLNPPAARGLAKLDPALRVIGRKPLERRVDLLFFGSCALIEKLADFIDRQRLACGEQ